MHNLLQNLLRPPPDKPQKVRKTCFLCRDFKNEKQNRSTEFEVVCLDRFCCPIALTIAPCFCHTYFWPLHAITNHNLNVSHSTRFLLFLSNSQVSPKFKESMFRVPFTHKAQIRCGMSQFLGGFCHALHFVVTHACTTLCRTHCVPLQISPKKFAKHAFHLETLRRQNGTDLVQNQSIEFEVVRLDRFCCPIALTIAVQNLCVVLLSHLFWPYMRLPVITSMYPNRPGSCSFLSNSQVSPKFKESMFRVPFTHKAQIGCVMS